MGNTTVHAGVCGFTSRIFATSEDEQHVAIRIETDCEKIGKLAGSIPPLDAYAEIQAGHDGELMKAVRANLVGCCAGCAVPCAIFKSMQVAANLNLPRKVEIDIAGG
jgi:hypothetical protein